MTISEHRHANSDKCFVSFRRLATIMLASLGMAIALPDAIARPASQNLEVTPVETCEGFKHWASVKPHVCDRASKGRRQADEAIGFRQNIGLSFPREGRSLVLHEKEGTWSLAGYAHRDLNLDSNASVFEVRHLDADLSDDQAATLMAIFDDEQHREYAFSDANGKAAGSRCPALCTDGEWLVLSRRRGQDVVHHSRHSCDGETRLNHMIDALIPALARIDPEFAEMFAPAAQVGRR